MHGVWLPSQLDPPIAVDAASPAAVLCVSFSSPFPLTAPPAASPEMVAALLVLGSMGSAAVRYLSTRLTPGMREEGKSPKDILKEEPNKLLRK